MRPPHRSISFELPELPPLEHTRPLQLDEISGAVVDTAIRIHALVGSSMLESAYETLLCELLRARNLHVERQVSVSLAIGGVQLSRAFRIDLLVENAVVLEVKSHARNLPVFSQQLLTYLRLADYRFGLMVNFGLPRLTQGLVRVVNSLPERGHAGARNSHDAPP